MITYQTPTFFALSTRTRRQPLYLPYTHHAIRRLLWGLEQDAKIRLTIPAATEVRSPGQSMPGPSGPLLPAATAVRLRGVRREGLCRPAAPITPPESQRTDITPPASASAARARPNPSVGPRDRPYTPPSRRPRRHTSQPLDRQLPHRSHSRLALQLPPFAYHESEWALVPLKMTFAAQYHQVLHR